MKDPKPSGKSDPDTEKNIPDAHLHNTAAK